MIGKINSQENRRDRNNDVTRQSTLESLGEAPKRRGFLKRFSTGIFATLTALFGSSGTAIGFDVEKKDERRIAARNYHHSERVRTAIEASAIEVLRKASESGRISSPNVTDLPIENLYDSVRSFARSDSGTMVFGTLRDGEPSVRIEVKKQLPDGQFKLVVVPERDHSFGVYTPDTGVPSFTPNGGKEVVSTSADCDCIACYPNEYCGVSCGPYSCGCLTTYWPTQCCNDCCYTGDTCGSCSKEYC